MGKGVAKAIVVPVVVVLAVAFSMFMIGYYMPRPPPIEEREKYIVNVNVIDKYTTQPVEVSSEYNSIYISPEEGQSTSAHDIYANQLETVLEEGIYRIIVDAPGYFQYTGYYRVEEDITITIELTPYP
ncbi:MAG: hypothetical protein H3Z53_07785 [archaeon]|nr:hypothetical protein [archaeon]